MSKDHKENKLRFLWETNKFKENVAWFDVLKVAQSAVLKN